MDHFRKGQIVYLTADSCEYGYGNEWLNIPLKIVRVNKSTNDHRLFDDGGIKNMQNRAWLYEFIRHDTKEDVPFACYDFELEDENDTIRSS